MYVDSYKYTTAEQRQGDELEYKIDEATSPDQTDIRSRTREYSPSLSPGPVIPLSSRVKMPGGKSKLVMLRDARNKANQRTESARAAAEEKRSTRHERGEFLSRDIRVWFEESCRQYTSLSRLPSWRPQDHSNAKRLLKEFGGDQLHETVTFFFEHWESYVTASRGRLHGIPTPSLLIAMKSQVFVDCELGKPPGVDSSKRDRVRGSEWDEEETPDMNPDGWGLD